MCTMKLFFLHAFLAGIPLVVGDVVASPQDINLLLGESQNITLHASPPLKQKVSLNFTSNNDKVVNVSIDGGGSGPPWNVHLEGTALGHDVVSFFVVPNVTDVSQAFVRVTVMRSKELQLTSVIVGWIYFAAWSVSFYPQVYENWKRKSVVGLNFDFAFLNLIGFSLYSVFNVGLYWIPTIEEEYFAEHPKGLNPVQLNDVFFSLHAVFITLVTVIQCLIYERAGQTVSLTARIIISIYFAIAALSLGLTVSHTYLSWLQFVTICSYLKLATTLIKYFPQAFMNYKRKSTVGWSIGNVVLDFTGGILSMLQMIINADNYDDWNSIFGDPTKFGLGLFSVLFDILFLIQHYILYKETGYEQIPGENDPTGPDDIPGNPVESDSGKSFQSGGPQPAGNSKNISAKSMDQPGPTTEPDEQENQNTIDSDSTVATC